MKVALNKDDSKIFKRNILDVIDFDENDDFENFEKEYIEEYSPFMAVAKIPVEHINLIHVFELNAFSFIEFQIKEVYKIPKKKKFDIISYPYIFSEVSNEEELNTIFSILEDTFVDDRFTIDKHIGESISVNRYKHFVKKSYLEQNEKLYKLSNKITNEIVAFKSHKYISKTEVVCLLGGVTSKYKKTAIPVISGLFELNELQRNGIRKLTTHVSGRNYGVINLEIGYLNFKMKQSYVVLRKIYE